MTEKNKGAAAPDPEVQGIVMRGRADVVIEGNTFVPPATEESKGAAVALPPTGWYGPTAGPEDTPLYTGQQMHAFRAEGEADLRARLAAAEAEVVRLRAQRDEAVAALLIAHDHIDMEALRISHCKDASLIDRTLASLKEQAA